MVKTADVHLQSQIRSRELITREDIPYEEAGTKHECREENAMLRRLW